MTTEKLIKRIRRFLRRHPMTESMFGRNAVNDGKLLSRLEAGGDVSLRTANRILLYMQSYERAPPSEGMSEAA